MTIPTAPIPQCQSGTRFAAIAIDLRQCGYTVGIAWESSPVAQRRRSVCKVGTMMGHMRMPVAGCPYLADSGQPVPAKKSVEV